MIALGLGAMLLVASTLAALQLLHGIDVERHAAKALLF
jgi:hypothetical protein